MNNSVGRTHTRCDHFYDADTCIGVELPDLLHSRHATRARTPHVLHSVIRARWHHVRFHVCRQRWALLLAVVAAAKTCVAADIDFRRDVRPILADKCYACHGPDNEQRQGGDDEKGGLHFDTRAGAFARLDDGFAIVPGKPGGSEVIRRINSDDADVVMPPADHPKQLTALEKKVLADWIRTGADWKDHWAYVSPVRHSAPETNDKVWPSGEIDSFVLAQLERDGFRPSKEAERRILLRRLTFDLTGLPPKPEHVRAFLADSSDNAWENQVDRLLMSAHYGERMAMYWLDLVRYADSVGYHGDQLVSVSPFRDYVINAFNSNMPFDCFTREQLSGDLLIEPSRPSCPINVVLRGVGGATLR